MIFVSLFPSPPPPKKKTECPVFFLGFSDESTYDAILLPACQAWLFLKSTSPPCDRNAFSIIIETNMQLHLVLAELVYSAKILYTLADSAKCYVKSLRWHFELEV